MEKFEDTKNVPDNTVPVPVEDYINLIEQTVLLLDQALNSILYSRRLQILKGLIKDPKKAKNILKEKADLLQKMIKVFLAKRSGRMLKNTPRNKQWRFSLVEIVALLLLLLLKSPFRKALHRTTTKQYRGGQFYYGI